MYSFKSQELSAVLGKISASMALYIPVETVDGKSEFKKYTPEAVMSRGLNTVISPKGLFFPQTENLAYFKMQGKSIEARGQEMPDEDFVIFGIRACDVKGIEVLDKVFLSEPADPYYKARREHCTLVSFACSRPAETCFCGTFGADFTDPSGDLTLWQEGEQYYIEAKTEKGKALAELLSDSLTECSDDPVWDIKTALWKIKERLPLSSLTTEDFDGCELLKAFGSDKWEGLSEACLGCGTCTFVCPTCQCYDIRDFDTGNGVVRFRCWDSCMYSDFTLMSAGQPRPTQKERFRQRFMHKLVYMPKNTDSYGCVGCGRCLASCPSSLNIVKVMKALRGETK